MVKYAMFIGRWSPPTSGHKFIINRALKKGKKVCIAIRDTPISEKDPYTYEQRKQMWRLIYGDKVKIVKIPDIESVNIGRKVGYKVNKISVPKRIKQISATDVRSGKNLHVDGNIKSYIKNMRTTFWFTGLPCSGKTTLALALKRRLEGRGLRVVHLDGDDIRKHINTDLDFTPSGRVENLRRVAEMCNLFNQNHITVVASFVSPTVSMRKMLRKKIKNFRLVWCDCPKRICIRRDVKGMWKKARMGKIKNFTGWNAPFDEPKNAIKINTRLKVDKCLNLLEAMIW